MTERREASCPKCEGRGHIMAYGHIANGVCFCCKGTGTITINVTKAKADLSESTIKRAEWIMKATEANYAKLGYNTLKRIRDFAHCGFGLQQAYPDMLARYREYGEAYFQAAQEEKLAAFYASA